MCVLAGRHIFTCARRHTIRCTPYTQQFATTPRKLVIHSRFECQLLKSMHVSFRFTFTGIRPRARTHVCICMCTEHMLIWECAKTSAYALRTHLCLRYKHKFMPANIQHRHKNAPGHLHTHTHTPRLARIVQHERAWKYHSASGSFRNGTG